MAGAALRTALRRAIERSLSGSKIADLSRVSSLPFLGREMPFAPRELVSDIDPRVIFGGAGLGMFPTAYGTAAGLSAMRRREDEAQRFEDMVRQHNALMGRYRRFGDEEQ